jgi:hypothetical protein
MGFSIKNPVLRFGKVDNPGGLTNANKKAAL